MAQIKTQIADGKLIVTVDGFTPFVIGRDMVADSIAEYAMLHGFKQKLVDSASLPSGATLKEKYEAIGETFARLLNPAGTWNKQGEGNGQPTGLLFKALCRLYPAKTQEALRAYLDKLTKEQQAALRKNPKIAPIIETIKAESAKTTGVDSDSLLSELDEI